MKLCSRFFAARTPTEWRPSIYLVQFRRKVSNNTAARNGSMRITRRKAARLTLSLLLAAGLGVLPRSAAAQNATTKKSSTKRHTPRGKKSSAKSRRRDRGQKAPTEDRISEIQQALAKDGSYAGTPNGKWDDSTTEAMKKFQESHGLSPSGKLDARTLLQLGLGSSITGVAPPAPSSTASKLVSSTPQTAQRPN